MIKTQRELKRELKSLSRQGGLDTDDLPLLSIGVILSAADLKNTPVEGVAAVDLHGNGNWELYQTIDCKAEAEKQKRRRKRQRQLQQGGGSDDE